MKEINSSLIRCHGEKHEGCDPNAVTQLDLSALSIGDETRINLPEKSLKFVFSLSLKSNCLESGGSIHWLSPMTRLEYLDLSFNRLLSIPFRTFATLLNLRTLKLEGNLLKDDENIKALRHLSSLRHVSFQLLNDGASNPICSKPNYNALIDEYLSKVTMVDGRVRLFRKLSTATKRYDENSFSSAKSSLEIKTWLDCNEMITMLENSFSYCSKCPESNIIDRLNSELNDDFISMLQKIHNA